MTRGTLRLLEQEWARLLQRVRLLSATMPCHRRSHSRRHPRRRRPQRRRQHRQRRPRQPPRPAAKHRQNGQQQLGTPAKVCRCQHTALRQAPHSQHLDRRHQAGAAARSGVLAAGISCCCAPPLRHHPHRPPPPRTPRRPPPPPPESQAVGRRQDLGAQRNGARTWCRGGLPQQQPSAPGSIPHLALRVLGIYHLLICSRRRRGVEAGGFQTADGSSPLPPASCRRSRRPSGRPNVACRPGPDRPSHPNACKRWCEQAIGAACSRGLFAALPAHHFCSARPPR